MKEQKKEDYGLMAEFETPEALYEGVLAVKEKGYTAIDAYSPFPIEAVSEEIENHKKSKVPLLVLIAGLSGATGGFLFQWWVNQVSYPLNIGGRPYFSWPAFIPVTFELTILLASFTAVIGMIILNGLPQPYHAVFNVPAFERATIDRYFLVVEAKDARYDAQETRSFLEGIGSLEVHDVEA